MEEAFYELVREIRKFNKVRFISLILLLPERTKFLYRLCVFVFFRNKRQVDQALLGKFSSSNKRRIRMERDAAVVA